MSLDCFTQLNPNGNNAKMTIKCPLEMLYPWIATSLEGLLAPILAILIVAPLARLNRLHVYMSYIAPLDLEMPDRGQC